MADENKIGPVRNYLAEQFGSAEITIDEQPAGVVVRVKTGTSEFDVTVVRDFLEAHDASDIGRLMHAWNVAQELRRTEGLPLVISEEGVRLASSN